MAKQLLKSFSFIITALALLTFSSGVAFAAKPAASAPAPPTGNDISWPQCNKTLPKGQAFGVVGVNGGLANNTNPCLATQLAWANQSKGGTGQPLVSLYVNTANPGLTGSWWPSSNDYAGTTIVSPYGTCDGTDTAACAYIYGYAKAYDDATIRGVSNPASYLWWLDVETINSWEANTAANAADLEGMTAYFQSIGARVGLYSTSYQWGKIVGKVSSDSNLNNLQSWIPGARSAASAKTNCSLAPLTAGSPVTLTQYVSSNLDYDVSCT
ncbi:MAG: hypothetical protein ABIR37_02910 [Candidatus Saccharimonadales bacterium]